ncbi:Cysteine-rich receptor-kinase-like protein [Melia azedarach]|uniref:Cysteine-rich receptor-kinase-like protein n=1 Tax=Melia azedarach TaxID=155640 RepID=A0ACC1WVT4_MELAZ|nr:Cysteine-rich receptor-kinase-like protein [Melia azedarach]
MASSRMLLFFCSIALHLVVLAIAQQDNLLLHLCLSEFGNFTRGSAYQKNLRHTLSSISANTKTNCCCFYTASFGRNSDQANALAFCRGDVKPVNCRSCIHNAILELPKRCPTQKESVIWYDYCMLRYSNRYFFGNMEFGPWFWMYNLNNVSDPTTFNQAVKTLLDSLKNQAAFGDSHLKFATGNTTTTDSLTIYALVQCSADMSQQQCVDCLDKATALLPDCCDGRQGGRVIAPSCNFSNKRYWTQSVCGRRASSPEIVSTKKTSGAHSPASPLTKRINSGFYHASFG